jgi:uncharacterized membrane protein
VAREPDRQQPQSPTVWLVERNIAALLARRQEEERRLDWQDRLAAWITRFAGSLGFVWLHVALVGAWAVVNLGLVSILPPFDPTFVILAMAASVEAIFLSAFILITQNRMQAQADRRADLNLQISLLAEHEVTRLVSMVSAIGQRMGIPEARSAELDELKADVRPEEVLDTLEARQGGTSPSVKDE